MNTIQKIAQENCRTNLPKFNIGDTLKVQIRITEGKTTRLQAFAGVLIARKGSGITDAITLRRVVAGQGVERVFPINSPNFDSLTVERQGVVRRSKLYYLRDKVGKSARIKEKKTY